MTSTRASCSVGSTGRPTGGDATRTCMTSTESPTAASDTRSMWGQPTSQWARAFTLFGLFGLGIAQPLLDLYGSNPEVFIANRSSTAQIVGFALVVTLEIGRAHV